MAAATAETTGATTKREVGRLELQTGQYVRHFKYGWGTVVEYDRDHTLVYFRSIGIKRLATHSANFAVAEPKRKRLPRARRDAGDLSCLTET